MQIEFYNAFIKAGLSEKEAKECVDSFEKKIEKDIKHEVDALRADVEVKTSQLVTKRDLEDLKRDLRNEFATKKDLLDFKVDMLKWYVATQIATLGFIFAFLKYFFHG